MDATESVPPLFQVQCRPSNAVDPEGIENAVRSDARSTVRFASLLKENVKDASDLDFRELEGPVFGGPVVTSDRPEPMLGLPDKEVSGITVMQREGLGPNTA